LIKIIFPYRGLKDCDEEHSLPKKAKTDGLEEVG